MSAAPPNISTERLAALIDLPSEADRWRSYEARKAVWLAANPGASSAKFEGFCAQLTEELGL